MVTGAAGATINRVPVLLLPGDIFAGRRPAPVLQQLESSQSQDVSVNDCFKPVSRYWDRINRPEQMITALPEAMRVLTSPAETGAVTLALPQDVQAEAYDYPDGALRAARLDDRRGARADRDRCWQRARLIRDSKRPLIVAGGGVIYSEATEALRQLRRRDRHRGRRDAGRQGRAAANRIRSRSAASAPPARWRPTCSRATPTWSSSSARG